ncbi:MAG: hypothetical protein L0Y67_07030 [Gammaproteobacteria bacterium]|nr:hypothetical protein [Gammaproteobacteria bacterium]MCI0591337.1 hypothetical protein [Gammaproteobacteria bacterium]
MNEEQGNVLHDPVWFRKRLKRWVAPYPRVYRLLVGLYHSYHFGAVPFMRTLIGAGQKQRRDESHFRTFLSQQQILSFDVKIGDAGTPDEWMNIFLL